MNASSLPRYRATVLQNGHVDHITGPRCMVRMDAGPNFGRYCIAQTKEVFHEGRPVIVNYDHGYARAELDPEPGYLTVAECERIRELMLTKALRSESPMRDRKRTERTYTTLVTRAYGRFPLQRDNYRQVLLNALNYITSDTGTASQ